MFGSEFGVFRGAGRRPDDAVAQPGQLFGRGGQPSVPSVGTGGEIRESFVVDGDGSRLAFGEVFGMEQVNHRQQVPRRAVIGHLVVILVALDDGMEFRPAEIVLDGRSPLFIVLLLSKA